MAEIKIHPDIADLEAKEPTRYSIYQTLLQGMKEANDGTPPDYNQPPYSVDTGKTWEDPEGNIIPLFEPDQGVIAAKMAEISQIQMQNAAYLFARVIDTASTTAATGVDLTKLVQKSGDSMLGLLGTLKGFEAGADDKKIFDVTINAAQENVAHVYGFLVVDKDVTIDGQLNLSDSGIFFSKHQCIFYKDNTLQFDSQNIKFTGDILVDGTFKLGDVLINQNGIFWGTKEFYHSGNSNNKDTDWSMKNAHVYGDLIVDGASSFTGRLKALNGFDLGEKGDAIFYSSYDDATKTSKITMRTDLNIVDGYGIKFDDEYIVRVRGGADNIVSFSAPGKVLNLGDSGGTADNPLATQFISLQADIKNDKNTYVMVSSNGDGDFRNSFQAGCANSGPIVIRTYYHSADDCGVMFPKNIALGSEYGPHIFSDGSFDTLTFALPHNYSDGTSQITDRLNFQAYFEASNYPWRNQSLPVDVSLNFDTEGEYFLFRKPILSKNFSILSDKCQTRLEENALFLDTGIFIEGVPDGMAFTGNAYFNNNVQSPRFASGFAGYGWGIIKSEFVGGYHATFDELTVRKKMRIYELEVQKIGATNGSLWISDSCSGDLVEEISETF